MNSEKDKKAKEIAAALLGLRVEDIRNAEAPDFAKGGIFYDQLKADAKAMHDRMNAKILEELNKLP